MRTAGEPTRPTERVLRTFVGSRGLEYHATRLIARGGMAEVYEGFHVDARGQRQGVAIKQLDAPDVVEALLAFDDEARLVAELAHPGIVRLLDYGHASDRPFQVLELVDGLDLRHVVSQARTRGRPIPVVHALTWIAEAAEAVHAAHEARGADGRPLGVIHRDVTPHNLLVAWDGTVKVADFGIAVWTDRSSYTAPGRVKGKLSFMAPEQLLGRPLDARVDVFGLGCALAYLFTGASPYASDAARMAGLRGVGPELDAELPPLVARLVAQAAAPDRQARFGTALELALACRRAARTALVGAGPVPSRAEWLRALTDAEGSYSPVTAVPTVVSVVLDTDPEGPVLTEPSRDRKGLTPVSDALPLLIPLAGLADADAPALLLEREPELVDSALPGVDRLRLLARYGALGAGVLYAGLDAAGVDRLILLLGQDALRDAQVLGELARQVMLDQGSDECPGLRAVDIGVSAASVWVSYERVEGVSLARAAPLIEAAGPAVRLALAHALVRALRLARERDEALGGALVERRWSLDPGAVWLGVDGRARLLDHLRGRAGSPEGDAVAELTRWLDGVLQAPAGTPDDTAIASTHAQLAELLRALDLDRPATIERLEAHLAARRDAAVGVEGLVAQVRSVLSASPHSPLPPLQPEGLGATLPLPRVVTDEAPAVQALLATQAPAVPAALVVPSRWMIAGWGLLVAAGVLMGVVASIA